MGSTGSWQKESIKSWQRNNWQRKKPWLWETSFAEGLGKRPYAFGSCQKTMWNAFGSWQKTMWNAFGPWQKTTWNADGSCQKTIWNAFGSCQKTIWNAFGSCQKTFLVFNGSWQKSLCSISPLAKRVESWDANLFWVGWKLLGRFWEGFVQKMLQTCSFMFKV